MSKEKPVRIRNLEKSFGNKKVLSDICFEVGEGEVFGLIGLNGAGKTTLIKILLGLLSEDSGEARIFGSKPTDIKSRKSLCYLPEKFNPSGFLKGKEFLSLSLSYFSKKFDIDYAIEKAVELGLDPKVLENRINKYSKGMGQKLGLVSAFLTDAPLLVLDEPMSGLDPRARIQLKDALLNYKKKNKTVFFSSHILSDIDEICDRIAIIHDHKLIFAGTPKEFKNKYKSESLERSFLIAIDGKKQPNKTKKKAA